MESLHYLIGQDTLHIAWWQMSISAGIIFVCAILLYRVAPRRFKSVGAGHRSDRHSGVGPLTPRGRWTGKPSAALIPARTTS